MTVDLREIRVVVEPDAVSGRRWHVCILVGDDEVAVTDWPDAASAIAAVDAAVGALDGLLRHAEP